MPLRLPPLIAAQHDKRNLVLIEGHSRAAAYVLESYYVCETGKSKRDDLEMTTSQRLVVGVVADFSIYQDGTDKNICPAG
jgi:hypothetical protein